jgi:hypothetical protein
MILTCNTAIDTYRRSSSCAGFGDESDNLTELTIANLHNGKSYPIIKGNAVCRWSLAFVVAAILPENLPRSARGAAAIMLHCRIELGQATDSQASEAR